LQTKQIERKIPESVINLI